MEEQKDQQSQTTPEPGSLAERIAAAEASVAELRGAPAKDSEPAQTSDASEKASEQAPAAENAPASSGEDKAAEQQPGDGKMSRKERRAEWAKMNADRIRAERDKEIDDRLRKLETGGEKQPTKADFPNEDAYVRYLAGEELKKLAAAQAEQQQAQAALAERYQVWGTKIAKCISPDEMEEYQDVAQDAGKLAEYLGEDVMGYIEESEVGPRMLYLILTNPRLAETLKNSHKYRTVQLLGGLEAVALKAVKDLQQATSGGSVSSAEAKPAGSVQSVAEARPAPRATGALGNGSGVKDFSSMTPDEMAASLQRKLRERRANAF